MEIKSFKLFYAILPKFANTDPKKFDFKFVTRVDSLYSTGYCCCFVSVKQNWLIATLTQEGTYLWSAQLSKELTPGFAEDHPTVNRLFGLVVWSSGNASK